MSSVLNKELQEIKNILKYSLQRCYKLLHDNFLQFLVVWVFILGFFIFFYLINIIVDNGEKIINQGISNNKMFLFVQDEGTLNKLNAIMSKYPDDFNASIISPEEGLAKLFGEEVSIELNDVIVPYVMEIESDRQNSLIVLQNYLERTFPQMEISSIQVDIATQYNINSMIWSIKITLLIIMASFYIFASANILQHFVTKNTETKILLQLGASQTFILGPYILLYFLINIIAIFIVYGYLNFTLYNITNYLSAFSLINLSVGQVNIAITTAIIGIVISWYFLGRKLIKRC